MVAVFATEKGELFVQLLRASQGFLGTFREHDHFFQGNKDAVDPHLMVTSSIRSPCCYGYFSLS